MKNSICPVSACFEEIAYRFTDNVAIEFDCSLITYGELLRTAVRIAASLPVRDTPSPARIVLLFKSRVGAIESILGVLRAGHAFVSLDVDDPQERLRLILGDCEPTIFMTDSEQLARAQELVSDGCRLINIDEIPVDIQGIDAAQAVPDDPACIFYTSGSTGQPKGVCQTRQNLLHFVRCYAKTLSVHHTDRLSLLYSLSFSAANMDIFGGLLNGATVCAYDMRTLGLPGLADWLDTARITILHTVPTVFRKLVDGLDPARVFSHIRAVDLGGEAVSTGDVSLFRRHYQPDCLLINHLAATEASVIAQFAVPSEWLGVEKIVPVGFSPEGVRVSIESTDGGKAAVGAWGRIVIESPYLTPGYWRQPELNSKLFHEHPELPGWRIFLTEDMGYIDADGLLHFIGRQGTRVKIRGQSVDLMEVEAALRACTGVREAAVVAVCRDEGVEADMLVAHVILSQAGGDASALRCQLSRILPHYMIPTVFSFPEALPLTVSGKIDRNMLQQLPVSTTASPDVDMPATMSALEGMVARIFEAILKRESGTVARGDEFFLLGGDSMSVVELQLCLSKTVNQEVALKDIFENATVVGLASTLGRLRAAPQAQSGKSSVLVPLREHGNGPRLFLIHGRLGFAHVSPKFLSLIDSDMPIYALQARGLDGRETPNKSIGAMARDYLAVIRIVQSKGPYFLGGFCAGGHVVLKMARMLRESGETVLPLLLIDPPAPPFYPYPKDAWVPGSEMFKEMIAGMNKNLRQRHSEGKIDLDINDKNLRNAACRVVLYFTRALSIFRPRAYNGEVFVLVSGIRISPQEWGNPATRAVFFSGDVRFVKVGDKHSDIFDVNNPAFSRALRQCIKRVRERMPVKYDSKENT